MSSTTPATLTPKSALEAESHEIERAISENVSILLHRSRMSATALAREVGISKATMNRKLHMGPWTYVDLARISRFYVVTVEELVSTLPPAGDWDQRWASKAEDTAGGLRVVPGGRRGPRFARPAALPLPQLVAV